MALKTPGTPTGYLSTSSAIISRPQQQNRRDLENQGFFKALRMCATLQSVDLGSGFPSQQEKPAKIVSNEVGALWAGVKGDEVQFSETV